MAKVKSNHRGYLNKLRYKIKTIPVKAQTEAANFVIDYLRDKMAETKTGEPYPYVIPVSRRGSHNIPFHASAPDEYPAIRTGIIFDSLEIVWDNLNPLAGPIAWHIDCPVQYADDLAAIRPFIAEAMIDCQVEIDMILQSYMVSIFV